MSFAGLSPLETLNCEPRLSTLEWNYNIFRAYLSHEHFLQTRDFRSFSICVFCSVSGAESEASPGALNNTEGMKQHEKEMQTTRDAIPDRGRETKMQNKTHQARNNR